MRSSSSRVEPRRGSPDRDPDRIARFGKPRREPTVRGALARRLNLARVRLPGSGGGRRGGRGAGTTTFHRSGGMQRVVVKVHHSRHKPGPGRSGLARHVSYLARDSASLDGERGVFYDAQKDAIESRQVTRVWEADRHHFRIIISPEKAAEIADLRAYIREVMQRIERDLGTKLQWIAINHHNTDNPHAHVLLRGVREDGRDLVIARHYIAHGMRCRANEVATELLGERTEQDIRSAKAAEVRAERFTSLDRMIERGLDGGRFDASPGRRIGFSKADRDLVVGRLQFLETLNLAHKDRSTAWRVEPDFRRQLTNLGARNDVIKQLYSTLGAEAGNVRRLDRDGGWTHPVSGVLVAKGAVDEISDLRFVAVRDRANAVHYAKVWNGEAYRAVRVDETVELGRGAAERRRAVAAVMAVAAAHGGIYRAADHTAQLRAQHARWSDAAVAASVRGHVRRLEAWADREGTGIRRGKDGSYRVDGAALDRFVRRSDARGVTDIRSASARSRTVGRSAGSQGMEQ